MHIIDIFLTHIDLADTFTRDSLIAKKNHFVCLLKTMYRNI